MLKSRTPFLVDKIKVSHSRYLLLIIKKQSQLGLSVINPKMIVFLILYRLDWVATMQEPNSRQGIRKKVMTVDNFNCFNLYNFI